MSVDMAQLQTSITFKAKSVRLTERSRHSLKILAIQAVAAGLFYAGYNYKATQDAKTHAAVQDALKAVQTAPTLAEASKVR